VTEDLQDCTLVVVDAPVEHEMKIPVPGLDGVRQRLGALGARILHARADEENWVLDDEGRRLAATGTLLRVRRYGDAALLTSKGPARFESGVKSRIEIECPVADVDSILSILAAVGLGVVRRYQKRREAWEIDGVTVALDETPMGPFVELEGPPERLARLAGSLGLRVEHAVHASYLALWEEFRRTHPALGENMLFP